MVPVITLGYDLYRVVDQAIRALARQGRVRRMQIRGTRYGVEIVDVRLTDRQGRMLGCRELQTMLAQAAEWRPGQTRMRARPPRWVASIALAVGKYPGIPALGRARSEVVRRLGKRRRRAGEMRC